MTKTVIKPSAANMDVPPLIVRDTARLDMQSSLMIATHDNSKQCAKFDPENRNPRNALWKRNSGEKRSSLETNGVLNY